MSPFVRPLWKLACALIFLAVVLNYYVQRPERVTKAFAGDLYHERYEQAAEMLVAPSALELAEDGSMTIVDHAGQSTVVPAGRLPFMISGGREGDPGDFSMSAIQGDLQATPFFHLYLSIDGGKVCIERVGS